MPPNFFFLTLYFHSLRFAVVGSLKCTFGGNDLSIPVSLRSSYLSVLEEWPFYVVFSDKKTVYDTGASKIKSAMKCDLSVKAGVKDFLVFSLSMNLRHGEHRS